ncbi:tripartite motif-containing protein 16-like [Misgurnus anguillicaudatus]|uniref:tripartite motif-containing protein 16-like n=1 Tax=Misgurnus anguillicaudatus TaxID=75329 RepID=UPI003CCFADD7
MAEASVSEDQFCCPICLDLLKDPVAIPCGHSYCMSCITGCWDQDDDKGVYSCPQCRQAFTPRPDLNKNAMLAEVVEKLKKTKIQQSPQSPVPAQCYADREEDVKCNVCTGRKYKAVKSCLVCLNSYCQNHLEQHEHLFKDKKHYLIDATRRLDQLICIDHDRPLEVFCRTDKLCICLMCVMDKHKNHDTEKASEERRIKQKQLDEKQRQFKEKIQQREEKLQELRDAVESHKRFAQAAVENCETIFTELINSIEKRRSEVTQLIRDQEKAAVSRAEGFMKQLKHDIDDLRRRNAELEKLPFTNDDIYFLRSFQSLTVLPESTDLADITVSSFLSYDDMTKAITLLREQLEDVCKEEIESISQRVKYVEIVPIHEPQTRKDFLQYKCQLSLDTNTTSKNLCLSMGNTVITNTGTTQHYPDHPDRFSFRPQVLCREKVCGRSYWEVEWSASANIWVSVSVAYKSISRKGMGSECTFGYNNQSWKLLCCASEKSQFWHNKRKSICPVVSSKIGVYVDHGAGTLAFYSISDTMTLIHKVQTTFTQPLYPGFGVSKTTTVKLCDLTM